ncbi:MAG: SDR family oxidoreductase [Planctomycetota bacterium]
MPSFSSIIAPLLLVCSLLTAIISDDSAPRHQDAHSKRAQSTPQADKTRRAILVTGASTGIGRKTAEHLAKKGFFVYAGARKKKDLKELSAIENIQGIRLDVTVQSEIDAAVATIEKAGRGLFGLINNAGVAVLAPLIEVSEKDFHFQMNVNLYGPYRVTKGFAPLIMKSKGRISTTGSLSGVATWGMGGPYCMSKHAIEAYSDVLAQEMRRFGVKVSMIEPGNYRSKITASMRKRFEDEGFSTEGSLYKRRLDSLLTAPKRENQEKEPDEVAEAFYRAMTDKNPKRRYLVVPNQVEAGITIRSVITRLAQLNADHPYSYNREQLIEMLDRALEHQKNR